LQQFYSRSPSVVSRLVGGETLIIPVRSGVGDLASIYSLNEVGSFIWRTLDRPVSLQNLAGLLAHEFEVEPDRAQSELSEFLEELNVAGLIAVTEQGAVDPKASIARDVQP
jgi:hypothetical protein